MQKDENLILLMIAHEEMRDRQEAAAELKAKRKR